MAKQIANMIPGFRRSGASRCQIRAAEILPMHMRSGARMVTDVFTEPGQTGKGYASTLMHRICQEADLANMLLVLEPKPYEHASLSQEDLEVWYAVRFGFQMIQLDPMIMARMPGATPKIGLRLTPVTQAVIERVSQ